MTAGITEIAGEVDVDVDMTTGLGLPVQERDVLE
jgi:hypothetical protein